MGRYLNNTIFMLEYYIPIIVSYLPYSFAKYIEQRFIINALMISNRIKTM